ncbi:MAG TPA: transposase, partial [Streptosporangiaceae bacterium]|nr:transposase [Streptosporangiaceae bacterium]
MVSDLFGKSGRAMLRALVAGERGPQVLAGLALGRLRPKQAQLAEALTGRFRDVHAYEIGLLLDLIDTLETTIAGLDQEIETHLAALPGVPPACTHCGLIGGGHAPSCGNHGAQLLSLVQRLDEITGVGTITAQVIIAELGLNMGQFPTAAHASAWDKLAPQTRQSGARTRPGKTGKGNRWLRGALGDAAMATGKTDTYLGERYRRIRRRRGKQKAIVATACAILGIAYLLISDRDLRFHDLGAGYYDRPADLVDPLLQQVLGLPARQRSSRRAAGAVCGPPRGPPSAAGVCGRGDGIHGGCLYLARGIRPAGHAAGCQRHQCDPQRACGGQVGVLPASRGAADRDVRAGGGGSCEQRQDGAGQHLVSPAGRGGTKDTQHGGDDQRCGQRHEHAVRVLQRHQARGRLGLGADRPARAGVSRPAVQHHHAAHRDGDERPGGTGAGPPGRGGRAGGQPDPQRGDRDRRQDQPGTGQVQCHRPAGVVREHGDRAEHDLNRDQPSRGGRAAQ